MKRDLASLAETLVLWAVLAIAALISYTHLRQVWIHAGAPWPALGPLLVDGLFAAAWLRMRRRRAGGEPVGPLAWLALGLALVATLGGNLAAAWISNHRDVLSLVVAAWPAVAFALVWELVTGHGRKPVTSAQPAAHQDAPSDPPADEQAADELAPVVEAIRKGTGRPTLMRDFNLTDTQARDLLAQHKPAAVNGRPR